MCRGWSCASGFDDRGLLLVIVVCWQSFVVGIDYGVRLIDFFLLGIPMRDNLIFTKRSLLGTVLSRWSCAKAIPSNHSPFSLSSWVF